MTIFLIVVVVGLAGLLVALLVRDRLTGWLAVPAPEPPDLEPSDDPLVTNIRRLADRVALSEAFNRTLKRIIAVLVLTNVLLFVVAGVAVTLVLGQKHTTDSIVSARTEARAATCRSDNTFIANHNRLVDAVEKSVSQINTPNSTRTADQQAALDKFIAEYVATIESARVPLRDCSPAAIAAFYKGGT